MNNQEIEKLLAVSEPNCISVIIPTHRLAPGKSLDPIILSKSIAKVKEAISIKNNSSGILINKLEQLYTQIRFSNTKEGLGIFISPSITKVIHFPFSVKERIKIGRNFESKELLFYKNLPEYLVLSVNHKSICLFHSNGEELDEINNEDFPRTYHEEYEYDHSNRASSYGYSLKAFESDKSVTRETRFIDFLRSADRCIGKYIGEELPLLLSGATKEVADFNRITKHKQRIIGSVLGSHGYNKKEIANTSWKFMQDYTKQQNEALVNKLRELIGRKSVVYGLDKVYEALSAGNGLMLLIEKEYEYTANKAQALRNKIMIEGNNIINDDETNADLVDKLIRGAMEKKSRVIFLDNGALADYSGVALILRYPDLMN
jgi:hypothetical protein